MALSSPHNSCRKPKVHPKYLLLCARRACVVKIWINLLDFQSIQYKMGSANSAPVIGEKDCKKSNLLKCQQEVVKLMMPIFYTPESIDTRERKLAVDSWNLIVTARSPEYLTRKEDPNFPHASCITFFYSTFYDRVRNLIYENTKIHNFYYDN